MQALDFLKFSQTVLAEIKHLSINTCFRVY